ncbi:MAG: tetratricopeptide repeat protein [Candidatus Aminicenantes bacterium]|nr:MAG: tetratricopeptide repeat protein [Candidatus Aminicenantes bacterium]
MKKKKKKIIIYSFILILFLGTPSLFGQKDYTREERQLFQRYKIANSYFKKGKKNFLKEDFRKAEKELKKCLKRMPEHSGAYFFLSQISYKWGNLERSLEEIENAKKNYAYIDKVKANIEQLYILELQELKMQKQEKLGLLRESLSRAQSALERSQIEAGIGTLEADIGTISSQLSRPLPSLEQMPVDYFYFHGNILLKLKRYKEADSQYQEAIKINPQHGDAYNNLASLYYMAKQYQKALDYLKQAEANGAKINPEFKKAVLKAIQKSLY